MIRLLSILVLAASLGGCATNEFEQEFWLETDGSGSFVISAPPWVWNAVKNIGESRRIDATVDDVAVAALFDHPAIRHPRVRRITRQGQVFITVSADFADINGLVGTKAFPDLVVSFRREGERLSLFGVWRRPSSSGTAQGDDRGLMAIRFHLPSEIFDQRDASLGVEPGNILSWTQRLSMALSGSPLDFRATLGRRPTLGAVLGPHGPKVLGGAALLLALVVFLSGPGGRRRRQKGIPGASEAGSDFLNYDPGSVLK